MLLAVGLPTSSAAIWLFGFSANQYESNFRFAVRRHTPPMASPATAAAMLSGGNSALAVLADSEMLVEYIRSRQAVDDAAAVIDLQSVYAAPHADWWSRLEPGLPVEDRVRHWRRFVDASLDLTSGLVAVDVRAFTPDAAQRVAAVVLADSERLVNQMSHRAQEDALRLAREETARTAAQLLEIRQSLAKFRNSNSLLSPELQASVQANVLSHLRDAVAEARAGYAAQLANGIHPTVPQMILLQNRIIALEQEVNGQRGELARPGVIAGQAVPLASVIAGYTELESEEHITELAYERSLAAESQARVEAISQSVYLSTFVQPATPERSTYPKRWFTLLQIALGSFVSWCILTLIWQSLREHMD
jgi:capsular polysaccharide transport system permease protein